MNKYIKLFISSLMIFGAVYAFTHRETGWGVFLIFMIFIPILIFFKNEFLLMALLKCRKGDLDGTKRYLEYIKNPKSQLIKSQQAYYYFLKGLTNANSNISQSERDLRTALEMGLKFKYNRAMAKLNLAIIAASKGRKKEAEMLLADSKKLDNAGLMEAQIKIVKEQLKRMNIGRNSHNPHVRRRSKLI